MRWLNKIHGKPRSPSGLEWKLLRKIPILLLIGTVVPVLVACVLHLIHWHDQSHRLNATLGMIDFITIGMIVVYWAAMLTLAIGCVIVILMKGPAYVADAYPLIDADRPMPE